MPKAEKRFYTYFSTTLPDQFVEANYPALCRYADNDCKAYVVRSAIIAGCSIGLCSGNNLPLLVANSPAQITHWMQKNGDTYNGRYWETCAKDNRGPASRTVVRTSLPQATWRTLNPFLSAVNSVPGSGITLYEYTKAMERQMQSTLLYGKSPAMLALPDIFEEAPRPVLKRETITAGEIVGYRCWRVENGLLRSVYQADIWPPNKPLLGRELDDWDSRGIHAWKDAGSKEYHNYIRGYLNRREDPFYISSGRERPAMVTGTVFLWGDVVEHERGYRAEHACIRSLDWLYPDETMMGREQETLQNLRKLYGVDQ